MTREEALAGHRRLWNEISDMIESGVRFFTAEHYKEEALFRIGEETKGMKSNCYCCHYAQGICHVCPVLWNSEDDEDFMCDETGIGEYAEFKEILYGRNYPAAADMARKIANLPERVVE